MENSLDESMTESLLKGIRVPPQPQILVDLQMEMAMPNFTLSDISNLISRDVGLSGYILKAVNSPAFGLGKQILSINHAIGLLGLESLINIINAVSIRKSLNRVASLSLNDFWDNAADVAGACAAIAKKLNLTAPEEAYTLGLFHNCGIPLLAEKFPEYMKLIGDAYQVADHRITDVENETIGTNHAVVGYYVARSWKLPSYFCEAIAEHHKVEQALAKDELKNSQKNNLMAILSLAAHFSSAYRVIGNAKEDLEFQRTGLRVLEYLGLSEMDRDDLREDLSDSGVIPPL